MSKNISLRILEKNDLDFVHRLYNDSTIMDYWFSEPHFSKDILEENYEKFKDDPSVRNFILQNDDERIGLVKLFDIHPVHRNAEFAIMIDSTKQGNGYAIPATHLAKDYAFQTLNLHKLFLIADQENKKAIHIYEKAGFKQEAALKEEFFVNGNYRDIVYMSIFQDDYMNMK